MASFIIDREGKNHEFSPKTIHQMYFLENFLPELPEKLNKRVIFEHQKRYPDDISWKESWQQYLDGEWNSKTSIFFHFWYRLHFDVFYSYASLIGFLCGVKDSGILNLRINDYDDVRDTHIHTLLSLARGCVAVRVDLIHNSSRTQETDELNPVEFYAKL